MDKADRGGRIGWLCVHMLMGISAGKAVGFRHAKSGGRGGEFDIHNTYSLNESLMK